MLLSKLEIKQRVDLCSVCIFINMRQRILCDYTHHLMTMSAVGEQLLACVARDSKDHT